MAKDQKKQPRPKAETPKGFRDYFGADVTERKQMLDRIAQIYHRHGFEPLETSAVETVERWESSCPTWTAPMPASLPGKRQRFPAAGPATGWRCAMT